MKRYKILHHGINVESDGEWVRYSDHVEAMKRIAGDTTPPIVAGFVRVYDEVNGPIPAEPSATSRQASTAEWLSGKSVIAQAAPSASAQQAELEPVNGDVLPAVGTDVLIHLTSQDEWVSHKVTGYYVWPDLKGNPFLQRVFVRVRDSQGYPNARMLRDVRRLDGTPFVVDKQTAAPAPGASPAALTETAGITKAEVLRVGVEVGLIDRVMDGGDYFTFADHEVMTPRLIKLIEAFRAAPAPKSHLQQWSEVINQLPVSREEQPTPSAPPAALTAKQRYEECMREDEEPSAVERLRFFCSLAMDGQDWLDVEPFFDDLLAAPSDSVQKAVTVWRDGRWKIWATGDAGYAQNDPDWLATIPLVAAPAPKDAS